jgi:anti-sigma-K factor RskA
MTAPADIHSLAGAYALDALDDIERSLFDDHVLACAACATEVAELRETAAKLAAEASQVPPPSLKRSVMAQIANTRQVLPPPLPAPRRPPVSRWIHRTRVLVAAGVAAVVAASGVYVVQELRLRQERIVAQAEAARINDVLSAPDAVMRSSSIQGGGRITIVTSAGRDEGVVVVADAKSYGDDKAYELWLIEGSTPKPVGLLEPAQVNARRLITGVRTANSLGLSIEPPGGSPLPSQPILAMIPLT